MVNPNQALLNRLVPKLRAQGLKATSHRSGICQYRSGDTLCCLIGQGIDDDHYDTSIEGTDIYRVFPLILLSNLDIPADITQINFDFWQAAQLAHDMADSDLGGFERRLAEACGTYGYEVPK